MTRTKTAKSPSSSSSTPPASSSTSVFRNFDEYHDDDSNVGFRDKGHANKGAQRTPTPSSTQAPSSSAPSGYEFTFKHQYSVQNNPLCGIEFPHWISLLKNRRQDIEWTVYWPRLMFISIMSIFNYMLGTIERCLYNKHIEDATPHPRPVFVLGHPRTGTTLLHNLIALDSNQFTYCSTFCAGFPSCFLWFEKYGKLLLKGVMDETRPMDNVKLHFDLPQEDELATCVLSGGVSPYMPLYFMRQEPQFRLFYAFDDDDSSSSNEDDEKIADPSVMAAARKRWVDSFMFLIRKLTVRDEHELRHHQQQRHGQKHQHQRRLVLKSPVHTARIRLLHQLFPEAQFVYIHRHPYDVLRSAIHMADTTYWYTYLSRPNSEQIMEFILRQYEILYDRYIEGRTLLLEQQNEVSSSSSSSPPSSSSPSSASCNKRIVEVSYDELSTSPIETTRRIYEELGWEFSLDYKTKLQDELGDVQSYQRNVHRPLPSNLKRIVNERWRPSFEMFGYTMDEE